MIFTSELIHHVNYTHLYFHILMFSFYNNNVEVLDKDIYICMYYPLYLYSKPLRYHEFHLRQSSQCVVSSLVINTDED